MSHDGDGEVNHSRSFRLYLLYLGSLDFTSGSGPSLPALILPLWGESLKRGLATGPAGQPGGDLANQGNHLTSTRIDAPGPPGKDRRVKRAFLTLANI